MSPGVRGKRSPRWAFWSRMVVPCKDGVDYLVRLRIVQTPWFGIYLHDIHEADSDDPHNHPWSFFSLVLRGFYVEEVYLQPEHPAMSEFVERRHHKRGSIHRMGRREAHLITYAAPGLKTLIFVGPRGPGWGFFLPNGKFIPWQDYEPLQNTKTGQRST